MLNMLAEISTFRKTSVVRARRAGSSAGSTAYPGRGIPPWLLVGRDGGPVPENPACEGCGDDPGEPVGDRGPLTADGGCERLPADPAAEPAPEVEPLPREGKPPREGGPSN